jgi:hypothetical protein
VDVDDEQQPPDKEHLRLHLHELSNVLACILGNIICLDGDVVLGEPTRLLVDELMEAAGRVPAILAELRRHLPGPRAGDSNAG